MKVFDLYSKRQKRLSGETSDVYVYDNIPQSLKVQIVHIWRDTLGYENQFHHSSPNAGVVQAYTIIVETLCREYGWFLLGEHTFQDRRDYPTELFQFILKQDDCDKILDAIELAFLIIDTDTRAYSYLARSNASELADAAINELNTRFQQHNVGYRFEDKIIRVDSDYLHAEVMKPALLLLQSRKFEGAQAEFLKAHEHYRQGRSKEALIDCLKSLESTMKTICAKRNWKHNPNATSRVLIDLLFEKELIPSFWNNYFTALRATLEGGVPPARNNMGGHGQGAEIIEVPIHLVAFVLHQTAAAIVFLVTAEIALP